MQNRLTDTVGVFKNFFVSVGTADCRDDTFADTGDYGFFACAADKTRDVCADGNTRLYAKFDTVFGDCGNRGGFDDFGVDADFHRVQDVASRKVDGFCGTQGQVDVRAVRRYQCVDDFQNVAARHIMRFKFHDVDFKPGFHGVDIRFDNHSDVDAAKAHTDKTSH